MDAVIEQWAMVAPELDTTHLGIVARVHRVAHQLRVRAEVVLGPHGLTQGEFDVLSALRRSGSDDGLTPSALAAGVLVSSGGMTKRLTALERGGWIARRRSPRDGRSVRVALTPAGRERLDVLLPVYFAAEGEVLEGLDDAERNGLADLLRELAVRLDLRR
ncbi:MarR family transcriptional regulator [Blastococcus sp. CT_GayMR19]|uniref:MarR family winged helix-turn-helix transcriptional regulator n=1 Tax=Blastococcus sp. CT_GayMR19 TaxID=2559608 RepID=UPI0010736E18|nr:MarR family transcriptional regulator [Blastococcus sp. CT_GayMR19]TFV69085.1 MarR family transcriptional regulator [Blastococcus sp. CT_GayMR19]